MAGLKKSKKVSWAPDVILRQVRLFLSEDAPSQFQLGAQDSLQAKASWLWHSAAMAPNDFPPPGFESTNATFCLKREEISKIPLIKWRSPPIMVLNPEWLVVSAEESEEVAVQNKRQLGALEALYPRQSSIPMNPLVSFEEQDSRHDDLGTPFVPITAIEDEDPIEQSELSVQFQQPDESGGLPQLEPPRTLPDLGSSMEQSHCSLIPDRTAHTVTSTAPSVEPDVVAAASAAFTAIMRSSEEGSMIDRDLLIKILSNPDLLEKLVSEYGALNQTAVIAPISSPPPPPPPPVQVNLPIEKLVPDFEATKRIRLIAPISIPSLTSPLPPSPVLISPSTTWPMRHNGPVPNHTTSFVANRVPSPVPVGTQNITKPPATGPPMKDMSYYKSLVQQHGEEKQEAMDFKEARFLNRHGFREPMGATDAKKTIGAVGSNARDVKSKVQKACIYFNGPRGCRHGASCLYQHDAMLSQSGEEAKGAKRTRLDGGIAGRN